MDNVLSFLTDFCCKNKIGIRYIAYMNPKDPSICYEWPRLIIYNENWQSNQEKPFILAHEIGHIMCGCTICYYHNHLETRKSEIDANRFAIRLLEEYCEQNDITFDNKYSFAEAFGVPKKLYYLLDELNILNKWY